MIPYLQKLADYDAWANQALSESLVTLPAPATGRMLEIFSHMGAAKLVWLDRIAHGQTAVEIWPRLDPQGAAEQLKSADDRLITLTRSLTLSQITKPVLYRTTKGESHATPLMDVIIHVVNHGTYHRGQLSTMIKGAGGTAAGTDYIAWVRR